MATLNIEINLDNAAFEDSEEVSRILRSLADRIEVQVIDGSLIANAEEFTLMDFNGNWAGSARISE